MFKILEFLKKEFREYIRSWKSWIVLLLLPLVIVPLSLVTPVIMGEKNNEDNDKYHIYIYNSDESIKSIVKNIDNFDIVENKDKSDISIKNSNNNNLDVYYDENSKSSIEALNALNTASMHLNNKMLTNKLATHNIPINEENINLNTHKLDNNNERGADILNYFLPIAISLMIVMGGMVQGSNAIAGEKDRQTIESLLSLPIKRLHILGIKFLVTLLSNLFMLVASILGILISVLIIEKYTDISINLSITSYLYVFLISSISCIVFSLLHLFTSTISKNVKEAQSYSTITSVVAIMFIIGGDYLINDKRWIEIIPGINLYNLLSNLLPFNLDLNKLLIFLSSNLLFATILFITINYLFKKEKFSVKN